MHETPPVTIDRNILEKIEKRIPASFDYFYSVLLVDEEVYKLNFIKNME